MDTPNTQMYNCSLSCHGTGTSNKKWQGKTSFMKTMK
jgi:hypothetical protein